MNDREQRLAEIREREKAARLVPWRTEYDTGGAAAEYRCDTRFLLAEVERLTAERDALRQACEVGYKEMERITGDRGFEPQRFRQRMNALLALGAVLGEATDGK